MKLLKMKLILTLIFLSLTYVWSNNITDNTSLSIANNNEDLIVLALIVGFIITIILLVFFI